jgi:hypothetical protein
MDEQKNIHDNQNRKRVARNNESEGDYLCISSKNYQHSEVILWCILFGVSCGW